MDAISFLGAPAPHLNRDTGQMEESRYQMTTYCWKDQDGNSREYTTCLFPLALVEFFQPERLHLFVTGDALNHSHYKEIEAKIGSILDTVVICDGNSESQLWDIFQKVTDTVQAGAEVIFDITHGFRSLPLVVFLAVAYLGQAKRINLERVVYGNFEARDKRTNRTPVFDLTSFVVLLDWLTGVNALRQRDDAEQLADLLNSRHNACWKNNNDQIPENFKPRKLQNLGHSLRDLSSALQLARPIDVMKQASCLKTKLTEARPEVQQLAKPFAVLLQDIESEYNPYAIAQPEHLTRESMLLQLTLIRRYASRGLVMQTVSLAREWLVSLAMLNQDPEHWLIRAYREAAASGLNMMANNMRPSQKATQHHPDSLQTILPHDGEIVRSWNEIRQLRNDIDHCGMREHPRASDRIVSIIERLPERLQGLLAAEYPASAETDTPCS